ncbi:hypothetical protein RJB91_10695 [Staphylococcus epidermidis]|nr:hypothetical protein [Staphylococcus epidermidis]
MSNRIPKCDVKNNQNVLESYQKRTRNVPYNYNTYVKRTNFLVRFTYVLGTYRVRLKAFVL